ncbi:hypothetical protein [Halodesulfovibrio marinisediminis]|uniref:Uncharacterized protein n=1 Tax=Halodesulfovibrio marinisediminis DSM 17456 TaxID=1121457 RepID=A0A1N6I6R2_9BACT|nr:hypothetical protein [Halodesulfovibrio marinisediminis]SIO27690.1 hypothetical protein SAMN02745161_2461 [Halodesulfovibrio marinisediminis DSM 17456]
MNTLLNDPQFLGLRLAGILVILTIFAVPSLPLISVISQGIAKSQKKSFYDKFGKQITRMCLVFGGTALAVLVLAVTRYLTIDPVILQGPYQLPIIITAGVTVLASLVSIVYFKVWKTMRKQKGAHMSIGLLSFIFSFCAVLSMVMVANILQSIEHFLPSTGTSLEILTALVAAANSEAFFTFTGLGFIMGFALCGTFAQVYLLARRNKDDFGRDYYKFAMPYAAKWSFGGALLQLAASVVLLSKTHLPVLIETMSISLLSELLENPIFMAWAFALVLPVIACLLWSCIVLCATPMRRKISIYCAAILMLIADISLLLAAYMGIMMTMAPAVVS